MLKSKLYRLIDRLSLARPFPRANRRSKIVSSPILLSHTLSNSSSKTKVPQETRNDQLQKVSCGSSED